ncbi:hypothetical protein [Arenimonas sp. GDDSR-1]|uniref:hypothetical protein n=1 Tax=Arenimonas sp. GDDSR-1 TaxID=2950125 RepID=UPI00260784D1|nr:hypothetical protein [Arenimonas sp. GDDSR-1]
MKLRNTLAAAIVLACSPLANASADEGWDWGLTPYLWASSISTDLREDAPPVGNETDFNSIISKIDMGFLGHVEGQGDDFGVFADVVYLSLADSRDGRFAQTDADLDTLVFELAGVWAPGEVRNQGIEVFGGLRHIVVDLNVDIDPNAALLNTWNTGFDQSFSDVMIGARYKGAINDKWGYALRADGSWGDTEGTYSTSIIFAYKTDGGGAWNFGYRYMDTDLAVKTTSVALQLHGPVVGYTFNF